MPTRRSPETTRDFDHNPEPMKRINSFLRLVASLLLLALGQPQARAYTHPCVPTTREELDTIKANLDKEPWKSGYALLANDGKSKLTYVPNARMPRSAALLT